MSWNASIRQRVKTGLVSVCLCCLFGVTAWASDDVLGKLWSELSSGDRTVISTAAKKAHAVITTVKGSANDKLWSELAKRGFLEPASLAEQYGENAVAAMEAAGFKAYSVTWKGAKELPNILEGIDKK
ncbi:MAG: hypothetical protein RIC14_17015 [Filomicrobium sp.]